MAVGIVADLIHLRLPTLPVSRPSIFSFLPSICCHAFWIRNRSLLLSRLYVIKQFVMQNKPNIFYSYISAGAFSVLFCDY